MNSTTANDECGACSTDNWDSGVGCISGSLYGFCTVGNCDGMCEYIGECSCVVCHGE